MAKTAHLLQIESEVPPLPGVERRAVRLDAEGGELERVVDVELPSAVALVVPLLHLVDLQVQVVEDARQVDEAVVCEKKMVLHLDSEVDRGINQNKSVNTPNGWPLRSILMRSVSALSDSYFKANLAGEN